MKNQEERRSFKTKLTDKIRVMNKIDDIDIQKLKDGFKVSIHLASMKRCMMALALYASMILTFVLNIGCLTGENYSEENFDMMLSLVVINLLICCILLFKIEPGEMLKKYLTGFWFFTAIFLVIEVSGVVVVRGYFVGDGIFEKNYIMIAILFLAVYTICNRARLSIVISFSICWVVLMIDYVVIQLRGIPIVPADLYSVSTAAKVASSYKLTFSVDFVNMVQVLLLVFLVTYSYCGEIRLFGRKQLLRVVTCICMIISIVKVSEFTYEENAVGFYQYRFNCQYGIAYNFLMNYHNMQMHEPDDYDAEKVTELANSKVYSESTAKVKPNIVVVMNESFSDIGELGNIQTTIPYMTNFNAMKNRDETISGKLLVSAFGGNTCNTEFEFLTGFSINFFPFGSVPYNQYIKKDIISMCTHLSSLGYSTRAFHPYWATSWQRNTNYEYLGFDKFISGENYLKSAAERGRFINMGERDFGDEVEYVRNYISDKQDYKTLTKMYDDKGDKPLFTFNITIQNHGGYAYTKDDFETEVMSTNIREFTLDQYLSLIKKSDDALKELVDYFDNYDQPTILLFFGDHQPSLVEEVYEATLGTSVNEALPIEQLQRKYTVPYLIWANYDINDDIEVPDMISPNYLQPILYEAAGLKQSVMSEFTLKVMDRYPAMNVNGVLTKDDKWISTEDAMKDSIMKDYNNLVYYYMFNK